LIPVPEGDYQFMAVANAPDHLPLWRSVHIAGADSERFALPSTTPVFAADFSQGLMGWSTGGAGNAWRAVADTSTLGTGGTLTTESPYSLYVGGQYANNLNSWVRCQNLLPLGSTNTATLTFWRRGRMDTPSDSLLVEVSSDGFTWHEAAGYSDLELPWTQSSVNLSLWTGQAVGLRFRFKTDGVLGDLGIHIDNLAVYAGIDSTAPLHPAGPVYNYQITSVYPNPFNPSTTIRYEVAAPGEVTLVVFNSLGQEVRRFAAHAQVAGTQFLAWDGTTARGEAVSSGLYFIQLQAGSALSTQKLLLLR
jgi:hypothetical protein